MAEEPGKKDDRKSGFTPEGEVLGYISSDRARVRPIEHADCNYEPDFIPFEGGGVVVLRNKDVDEPRYKH